MERKIGEIFEHKGEWYQCIIGHCNQCSFDEAGTCKFIGNPHCAYRNDKKLVCFKKLEKIGEPYSDYLLSCGVVFFQKYKLYCTPIIEEDIYHRTYREVIDIEIKQNKEDMEEKKLNLKPFDIQKAREGKPVCTRDGRKARIICFDRDCDMHIVALVADPLGESVHYYLSNGKVDFDKQNDEDLMMLSEEKEGWVNVYNSLGVITVSHNPYDTKEEALANVQSQNYVDTVKISWEE